MALVDAGVLIGSLELVQSVRHPTLLLVINGDSASVNFQDDAIIGGKNHVGRISGGSAVRFPCRYTAPQPSPMEQPVAACSCPSERGLHRRAPGRESTLLPQTEFVRRRNVHHLDLFRRNRGDFRGCSEEHIVFKLELEVRERSSLR